MTIRGAYRRLTFRSRLAIAFGAIAFGTGTLVLALLYAFMRFVPNYLISTIPGADQVPTDGWGNPTTSGSAQPSGPVPPGGFIITDVDSILDLLLWAGIAILIVVTTVAAFSGWRISGRMLTPLAEIGAAARQAGSGKLSHRISLDRPKDEIHDLASTFNSALDRLERAFTAHERFAANAAHELRTPLTATKTLLDVAQAHPTGIDLNDVLAQVGANNNRSIEIVQALLNLTAIESAQVEAGRVDLAEITERVIADSVVTAVEGTRQPAQTEAEASLIGLLIDNLVRNAIQHNDARGFLRISTGTSDGQSWVRVENTGQEISDAEAAMLFEPLYRVRRSDSSGLGLGLAIAKSIADAHSASLELNPRAGGGLTARLTMPKSSSTRNKLE